jgi:hypothetical protein
MDLSQLKRINIKDPDCDYKLMTGGKISLPQAYCVGETAAAAVDMTPSLNLTNIVRANGGEVHHIDHAQFESFWKDGINVFENSIYVHAENDFDIIIPAYAPLFERRYTIAHELGHYSLHSDIGKCYALRQGDDIAEREADCFALGFLLPAEKFKKAYQQLNKNVEDLSTMFLISDEIIKARIRSLRLS